MKRTLVQGLHKLVGNAPLNQMNVHRIGIMNAQFSALEAARPKLNMLQAMNMEEGHKMLRKISQKQLSVADSATQEVVGKVQDSFYSGLKFRFETQAEYNARVISELAQKREKAATSVLQTRESIREGQRNLIRLQLTKEFPDLDVRGISDESIDAALDGKPVVALPDSIIDRVTREANERLKAFYPHTQAADVAYRGMDDAPLGTVRPHPTALMRMAPLYDLRTKQVGAPMSFDQDLLAQGLKTGAIADEFFGMQKNPLSYFDVETGKIMPLNKQDEMLGGVIKKALPVQEPLIPNMKDRSKILSAVLDLLEGQHQKPAMEAIQEISDGTAASYIIGAVGESIQPGVIYAVQTAIKEYLQAQVAAGARTIQLPDERFVQAFTRMLNDEMPRFLERVNDKAFQAGFISEKMNEISKMYYKPQYDPIEGVASPPVVSKIAESLTEINAINKSMASYYYDNQSGNVGEFMAFNMYFGMVNFENHPQYAHLFERIKKGLPAFENPEYQIRRKMNELRSKAAPGETLQDILNKVDSLMTQEVGEIPQSLSVARGYANQQFEALQDTFGLNGMSLPARLTAKHVHNIDLIDKLEILSINALAHGKAAEMLTRAQGLDYFQGRMANTLIKMGPEDFSRFFYNQTYGILTVDKSLLQEDFDSFFLADLKDLHGIDILFEDNGMVVFKGDMQRAANYTPLSPIKLPDDLSIPSELRAMVKDVEDSIYAASELRPTFGLLDGGGLRVNGEKIAEFLKLKGIMSAEEAEEFANQIQHSGLLKTSFVGGHLALKEVINSDKAPGSALSVWSNSLMSLSSHSSTRYVFMRHLFDPSSSVGYVFGDNAEVAFEAFKKASLEHPFTFKFVFLDAKGNIKEFVPKSAKDMQLAIDLGLTVTTYSGMVNFSKKLDTFELQPLIKWIDQNVTTFYKAGYFMNLGIAIRNGLDTPLKALMTSGMGVDDLIASIRDAHKYIKLFSRVIKESGGLIDKQAVEATLAKLTPEELRIFRIMEMLYHYKITGTPLSSIIDITDDKRMYEIANGLRKKVATDLQGAVWNFPPLKFILSIFGDIEEHVRIAVALYRLNNGASMDSIVASSARQFVDYSYKSPGLQTANAVIPFVQFALSNASFWADEATTNPILFKTIIELASQTTINQAAREKRELSRAEIQTARAGNFKMGADTFRWNPSLFDAIGLIPGVLTGPTQRLNPVIRNLEKVLSGDVEGFELPFESPVTRTYEMITDTLPKLLNGESLRAAQLAPSIMTSFNETPRRSGGLSRSYNSATESYNRFVGRGTKMGARRAGIARSSVFQKKQTMSLYRSMYTKGGTSRMAMRMSPTTTKNLKYKAAAIRYRFR